jgi:hypothetical protein
VNRKSREGLLPFKIEQSKEPLIARGGLVLPYEMARALKLPAIIDRELPSPGSGHAYKPSEFVMPLILMIHGGGKKLEDMREIRGEVSLRELLGMEDLPASCTVGDWLRRMGQDGKGLTGLGKAGQHLTTEILKRDCRSEYTLDNDATVIETEKEAARWTYKKEKGYQPLLGFLFESGLILGDEFRDGNIPAGAGALEFLKYCVSLMPAGKRISYFRSDSAAYQAGLINQCFSDHMLFTITADQDKAVKAAIKAIKGEEWHHYEKDREVAETIHTMNETKEAFRLIVQRWPKLQPDLFDPEPYCYHVIATNREEEAKKVISLHNQRGQIENYIKELKDGFGMNWMPCGETNANAVFFRIGVIAYNLFQALKLLGLPVYWRNTTIATARWKLFQVAIRLVNHAHQIILKVAASIDKINLFKQVRQRCLEAGYG